MVAAEPILGGGLGGGGLGGLGGGGLGGLGGLLGRSKLKIYRFFISCNFLLTTSREPS